MNTHPYIEYKYRKSSNNWSGLNIKYEIKISARCSDYLKNHYSYRLTANNINDVKLLYKIFKALKPTYVKVYNSKLIFRDDNRMYKGLMFKLSRYIRHSDTRLILETISELLDNGFEIYEAIPLGHYCKNNLAYYSYSGDLLCLNNILNLHQWDSLSNLSLGIKYTSLDQFKSIVYTSRFWSFIFRSDSTKNKLKMTPYQMRTLVENKEYDKIKEYLNG